MNKIRIKSIKRKSLGFTLAELLIALAILGVIATFTIPKILDSGSNAEWNAKAKEAMSMVAASYQSYKAENTPIGTTTPGVLTPYMNYVRIHTGGNIGGIACSASEKCLILHNNALLELEGDHQFGGTGATNAWTFFFLPEHDEPTTPFLPFVMYYNGRITNRANVLPGTIDNLGGIGAMPDPPWFSWDN